MDSEVIRSFLVSVGVETSENEIKNFGASVAKISKMAADLGAAAAAAATAVSAMVVKVSSEFEDLYYASQRLRASVTNIKAFDFGVAQMGGNAKDARASLEGLASMMRSNPASTGLLASWGVNAYENGQLRDTTDIMRDLGDRFRAMPYWIAKIRAGMLGIDEGTLQAMIRGTGQWSQRYKDLAGDLTAASESAARFMQQVRLLRAEMEVALYHALIKIQEKLGPGIQRALDIAGAALAIVGAAFGWLIDLLGELDRATDGWSTALIVLGGGLASVLRVLALVGITINPVVAGIIAVAGAIALLKEDYDVWKSGGESLIDWSAWSAEIEAAKSAIGGLVGAFGELGGAIGGLLVSLKPLADAFSAAFGPMLDKAFHYIVDRAIGKINALKESVLALAAALRGDMKGAAAHTLAAAAANAGIKTGVGAPVKPAVPAPRTAANDNRVSPAAAGAGAAVSATARDVMNYFERQGWTREQAAGIAASLKTESQFKANAVGDSGLAYGAAQWHPDRQAMFRRVMGKDIRGSSLQDQLAFVQWELMNGARARAGNLLRGATTARQAGQIVSRYYEGPRDVAGEMARRGDLAEKMLSGSKLGGDRGGNVVTIQSKTDIKVTGTAEPKETAAQVGKAVDNSNAALLRNTQGAVR